MAQTSTQILETCLGKCFTEFIPMVFEAPSLSKLYWSEVSPDATYTALGSGAAATFSTQLTKQEVINGLTIAEQVDKFFQNQALTQADYRLNIQGIIYGNDAYTSPGISPAIEDFGTRLVTFCNSIITALKCSQDTLDVWFSTDIDDAVNAVTTTSLPFYSSIDKQEVLDGIVLIENFDKLITNQVATQAQYETTVSKYIRIIG